MKWKVVYDNGSTDTVEADDYQEAWRRAVQDTTLGVQSIGLFLTDEEAEAQRQQCVKVWNDLKHGKGFDAEQSVLVCADSWAALRKIDVFRLFDSHDPEHWSAVYKCLKRHRPELAFEACECMTDLEADLSSFAGDIPGTTL